MSNVDLLNNFDWTICINCIHCYKVPKTLSEDIYLCKAPDVQLLDVSRMDFVTGFNIKYPRCQCINTVGNCDFFEKIIE